MLFSVSYLTDDTFSNYDNLLLHGSEHGYLKYLEDLLKMLLKNSLTISPKKCQLFRTELQYMGNTFLSKTRICNETLKAILEAI